MKNGRIALELLCTALFAVSCFFSCSAEAADNGGQGNNPTTASYKVEHYQQKVSGSEYDLVSKDTQTLTGTIGEKTAAQAKTYTGFTAKSFEQETVAADGKTVVKIYYDRNTITLTINLDGGTASGVTDGKLTGLYGAPVTIAQPERDDYNFIGWTPALPSTFPAENESITALWISSSMTGAIINVTVEDNPEIEVLSAVQSTGKVTFTAEDGFTNYKWYVNGFNGVQGTSRVFELNTANLSGGTYTVTVRAEKNGITFSAMSYVVLDKTAPAKVSNLRVTSVNTSANKVSLTWTNPSDSDFAKAKIYWTESDGEHSMEVSGTAGAAASADVAVSNASNSYEFKVRSVDEFGNESSSKYVTSNMVMKVVSDGSYVYKTGADDPDGTSRFETKLNVTGFDYATVGTKFSFKFKFTNFSTGPVDKMYVRTNIDKFLYYGAKNGTTLTELTGDWAGWYEVSGTVVTAGASWFFVVFNHNDDVAFTNDDALYIADFKCSASGGGELSPVKNSNIDAASNGTITPVKSYVTLSDAN